MVDHSSCFITGNEIPKYFRIHCVNPNCIEIYVFAGEDEYFLAISIYYSCSLYAIHTRQSWEEWRKRWLERGSTMHRRILLRKRSELATTVLLICPEKKRNLKRVHVKDKNFSYILRLISFNKFCFSIMRNMKWSKLSFLYQLQLEWFTSHVKTFFKSRWKMSF